MKILLHTQSAPPRRYPYALLKRDSWDDYGYRTTFNVTLFLSPRLHLDLGVLKILRIDQTTGKTPLPPKSPNGLNEDYCSLGSSLDYYERLKSLGQPIYDDYLTSIRDAAYSETIRKTFQHLEGFRVSLMRFSNAEGTIEEVARLFGLQEPVSTEPEDAGGFKALFETSFARGQHRLSINFDFRRRGDLPHRTNVVIGPNGTGKTQLLSNLAIAASGYGYREKSEALSQKAGRFVGDPPPTRAVVVISYSAFDTFAIPGQSQAERRRLEETGEIFGYIYCGLRVHARSANDDYRLRTPSEINEAFSAALSRVRSLSRQQSLTDVLLPLLNDQSFLRSGITRPSDLSIGKLPRLFRRLSSGHKIALQIAADLVAYMHPSGPTLVLLDEPETHLHPPLLAALLRCVRDCLVEFNGYAIIATHSPVVLQETPSAHVRALRRTEDITTAVKPAVETFGESVGVITQEVFGLVDHATDWHDTLRHLAKEHSLKEIEAMFGGRLGMEARSYLISFKEEA